MTREEAEEQTTAGGVDLREALAGVLSAEPPGSWLRREDAPQGMNIRDASVLMLFGHGQEPRTPAGRDEMGRLADLGVADVDVVLLQRAATLRHHRSEEPRLNSSHVS